MSFRERIGSHVINRCNKFAKYMNRAHCLKMELVILNNEVEVKYVENPIPLVFLARIKPYDAQNIIIQIKL